MAAVAAMVAFSVLPCPGMAPASGRRGPAAAAAAAAAATFARPVAAAAAAVTLPPGGSRLLAAGPPRQAPRMAHCVRCGGDYDEDDNSPSAVRLLADDSCSGARVGVADPFALSSLPS